MPIVLSHPARVVTRTAAVALATILTMHRMAIAREDPRSAVVAPRPGPGAQSPPDQPAARTEKEPEQPVRFDLGLTTAAPLFIGGQATLELPFLLLRAEMGLAPSMYVNAIDGVLSSAGAYDAATSSVVRSTFERGVAVRVAGGLRPWPGHGLEIVGGYAHLSLSGAIGAADAVRAATGAGMPADVSDFTIPVSASVGALYAAIGWRWTIARHVVIGASLGYLQAVSVSSRLEVPSDMPVPAEAAAAISTAARAVEATLDGTMKTTMKMPLVSLSLTYRF